MTKLESELTRVTSLVVDGREVDVTLLPADEGTLTPERLQLHLKGTQQYKTIPLTAILKAVGWKVTMPKAKDKSVPDKLIAGGRVTEKEFDEFMGALEEALAPWKDRVTPS